MMLALELYRSLPKYATARALNGTAGRLFRSNMPGLLIGPMAPLRLVTVDEPSVRRDGWVRLRPRLSGICGSDLGAVTGATSLYFSALVSTPFVPGHEVVAELLDDCADLPRGTRVVVDPVLACAARGLGPCVQCAAGHTNRCERVTVGHLAPGLQTGFCADTGGGWGEVMIAHRSQLHVVPDSLEDEQAVLIEPLACAVRLAERAQVPSGGSVLISGAGAVGLFAVLAMRERTSAGRITVVAKHQHQAELARAFGASEVVRPDEAMRAVRRATRALTVTAALPGSWGQEMLLGGVDVAIDCVGSAASLDLALRVARGGARVVLSGMPAPGVDLSPAWFRELDVVGTYASAGPAFEVATEIAATELVEGLVSGRYPLHRWREALDHASSVGHLGGVKVCFDVRSR